MMKKISVAVALALGLATVSTPVLAKKVQMTPMELQAIQSKEFETTKDAAFGAVMTVVQDLGYTVESADLASGFITAASPTENKTSFLSAMVGVSASGNTVLTAFLMQMPSGMTRVRLNFVNSKNESSAYGRNSRQDKPILDPQVYRTAWDKIDEALFVMGALTSSAPKTTPAAAATEPASPVVPQSVAQPAASSAPAAPPVASSRPVIQTTGRLIK